MNEQKLKEAVKRAKEIIFETPDVVAAWNKIKSINSFKTLIQSFSVFWIVLKAVALAVEVVCKELQMCTNEERINVAAELLDEMIEFKGWLSIFEPFDDMLFKLLLSAAVQAINDKFGKNWMVAIENISAESDNGEYIKSVMILSV